MSSTIRWPQTSCALQIATDDVPWTFPIHYSMKIQTASFQGFASASEFPARLVSRSVRRSARRSARRSGRGLSQKRCGGWWCQRLRSESEENNIFFPAKKSWVSFGRFLDSRVEKPFLRPGTGRVCPPPYSVNSSFAWIVGSCFAD